MQHCWRALVIAGMVLGSVPSAWTQIDPNRRELIQAGYTQPVEGSAPVAAYAFYFLNKPGFLEETNVTLRLAVAPVYLDSEIGFSRLLGPNTDVGLGLAGGGFADGYSEVRNGDYSKSESFFGHCGDISSSIYHLFNPGQRIPLYGLLRGAVHGSVFADSEDTDDNFVLPEDQFSYRLRAGFRWGGREPVMMPDLAMEVSAWYEGSFRTQPGVYGFDGDRELNSDAHLAWGRALITYTLPNLKHSFGFNVTGGTGWHLDRFSAYRIGGNLPLYSEFPLTLPGYYFQELSARSFALFGGNYVMPIDSKQRWRVGATVATAWADYLPGLEYSDRWNSGVGGGLIYRSPSDAWQLAVMYGYGIDAVRDHGTGAQSVTFMLQWDLGRTIGRFYDPTVDLNRSRGLQGIMKTIFR